MYDITTQTKITVPFYDLDPMNIVWHGNYVKYLEVARCDFFKKIGYTYTDMYAENIMYPIAKIDLKFIKSAYFGQELIVKCILKEIEPAILLKYIILDAGTGEKICTANSMQIGVDTITKQTILKTPQTLINKLENFKND